MTLSRKTPLKRVGSKVRRVLSPRCSRQRCNKIARVAGYCTSHAAKVALTRWSQLVRERDGKCMARALGLFTQVECWDATGHFEADHLMLKGVYPVTKYDLDNGCTLCTAHHKLVTDRPLEHRELGIKLLGAEHYGALEWRARNAAAPDLGDVLEGLRKAAA